MPLLSHQVFQYTLCMRQGQSVQILAEILKSYADMQGRDLPTIICVSAISGECRVEFGSEHCSYKYKLISGKASLRV